jgi:hypothetical protein
VGSSSAAQTFTVTNTGTANLIIGTIGLTGTDPTQFSKQNDNCSGQTIAPSGTCTVQAVFSPASAGGMNANLSIPSNAPTVTVPLSGTGTVPNISTTPSSHNFGSVNVGGSSTAQTLLFKHRKLQTLLERLPLQELILQFSKQNDNCWETIAPSETAVQAVSPPEGAKNAVSNSSNARLNVPLE